LVKLLVDEPGTEEAQSAYHDAEGIRTTAIAHVEATAALSRMRKGGRLTPAQLLAKAAESARTHSLRAYDSIHLAGALSFAAGEELEFACWDKELRDAAKKHGFALIPQRL
jgi:predicted nucleic acid-binding protein